MEHVRKYADEMQELCIDNDCISKNLLLNFQCLLFMHIMHTIITIMTQVCLYTVQIVS